MRIHDYSSTIELKIDTDDDFEPEVDGVTSAIFGTLYRVNRKVKEEIGKISGYVYDDSYGNLLTLADMNSQDHYNVMQSISFKQRKDDEKSYVCGKVGIIDHVYINPKHQGEGHGTEAMEDFLTFLSDDLCIDHALLMAHPLPECLPHNRDDEELNDKELKENELFIKEKKMQLSRFYQQLGFIHTGNPKENCMVKNLQA